MDLKNALINALEKYLTGYINIINTDPAMVNVQLDEQFLKLLVSSDYFEMETFCNKNNIPWYNFESEAVRCSHANNIKPGKQHLVLIYIPYVDEFMFNDKYSANNIARWKSNLFVKEAQCLSLYFMPEIKKADVHTKILSEIKWVMEDKNIREGLTISIRIKILD